MRKFLYLLAVSIFMLTGTQLKAQLSHEAYQASLHPANSNYHDRVQGSDHSQSWEFEDLFDEVEMFEEGSFIIQFGIGLRSDVELPKSSVEINNLEVTSMLPGLTLTLEKRVAHNVGVGITLGTQWWEVPTFDYQYRYYTGSLRFAYHVNVSERLDPYVALTGVYRYMLLTNLEKNVNQSTFNIAPIIGARYYFNNSMGGFLEIGSDSPNWFKAGVCFHLGG